LGLAWSVGVSPLMAQDAATAAALFDKGLAEMQARRFDAACPALAESYRLDPQPGALFTLAECFAEGGKVASASARYDEYIDLFSRMTPGQQAGQRGRDKIALQKKQALQPRIPTLTLVLPKDAPAGTRIKRDGVVLNAPAIGTPLPIDPGEHVITSVVPNGPEHEQRISVAEAEKKEFTVELKLPPPPPVDPAPATSGSAPPPAATTAPPAATTSAPATTVKPTSGGSTGKTLGWITTGIGIAGIGVGSVFGLMALQKKGDADNECPNLSCTPEGMKAVQDGRDQALISTIGFGVGAAGLVTGIILFATSGGGSTEQKTSKTGWRPVAGAMGTRDAMVGVQGTW